MRASVLTLTLAMLGTGCGLGLGLSSAPPQRQTYSMNGVKLISESVARGDDPATFGQESYELAGGRRLLLRFEELNAHLDEVRIDGTHKVEVQVTAPTEDAATAASETLRLCPLTRNWMMLSTWESAHPFGGGRWRSPGADFDDAGCVKAHKTDQRQLLFDVTTWFIDYPRGRGENFGLVLIPDAPVTVAGENSGTYSPRILWSR